MSVFLFPADCDLSAVCAIRPPADIIVPMHACEVIVKKMECRKGCGACCIAPSLLSPIPGMPDGKPAGVRCAHLTEDRLCGLYGRPERPAVCLSLQASEEWCGSSRSDAMRRIALLEAMTL